jgi:FkbM family methyltransferase
MNGLRGASLFAAAARMYPFFSGCGTLANHPLLRRVTRNISEDSIWVKSIGGEVHVSLHDYVGRSVFFFGDYDPKITWVIRRLLKPGDRVLDVGANIGLLTLLMSKLVGEHGLVDAFEPNPMLCRILDETLARHRATNVQLHPVALGACGGHVQVHVPQGNFGAASIVRTGKGPAHVHNVPIVKLDDIMFVETPRPIALMKLDVEGYELEIIKGAQRLLQEFPPQVILFESDASSEPQKGNAVLQMLREHGYDFLSIPRCLIWMRTQHFNIQEPHPNSHDLVAVKKGASSEQVYRSLRAR